MAAGRDTTFLTRRMKLSPKIPLALLALMGNVGALAGLAPSAVFCQREKANLNILAVRILPDGDMEFGLTKWEEDQNFSLFGIAKREGRHWIYLERDAEYIYGADGSLSYVGENHAPPALTCRVIIKWPNNNDISLIVDEIANCPGSAGYGFVQKSSQFTAKDYLYRVTFELTDSDAFLSAHTADGC